MRSAPASCSDRGRSAVRLLLIASLTASTIALPRPAYPAFTERVSVSSTGEPGNGRCEQCAISADGRFVAFDSYSTNLAPETPTGPQYHTRYSWIFVRDRLSRTTECVSVSSTGELADGESSSPAISADGRFVAFDSSATNLVPETPTGPRYSRHLQVFVRDRLSRTTECVSVSSTGQLVNGQSSSPAISADGRFVAFHSDANLVPEDTNVATDIFVRDRLTGTVERVSVSTSGEQSYADSFSPAISADGRFVAFVSKANAAVRNYADKRQYILLRDRLAGVTEQVSVSPTGEQANDRSSLAAISADGRFVAFSSLASNLVPGDKNGKSDIFVRDRLAGATERVSVSSRGEEGNEHCEHAVAISADGRFAAFKSSATNLAAPCSERGRRIFVHDRLTRVTECVSVSSTGEMANSESFSPAISAHGQCVAFRSSATNLVAPYANWPSDIFLRSRTALDQLAADHSACNYLEVVAAVGFSRAPADTRAFCPKRNVNSAEMTLLVRGGLGLLSSNLPAASPPLRFDDLPCESLPSGGFATAFLEAMDYITTEAEQPMVHAALAGGGPANHLCCGDGMTRAEMALYLARAIGGLEVYLPAGCGSERFSDVPCDYAASGTSPSLLYTAIEYIADAADSLLQRQAAGGCKLEWTPPQDCPPPE